MTTVTLNQLLEMENVLATRKIPSDIEAVTNWKLARKMLDNKEVRYIQEAIQRQSKFKGFA